MIRHQRNRPVRGRITLIRKEGQATMKNDERARTKPVSEEALINHLKTLRRIPGAQSEYNLQALRQSYESLLKYLPRSMTQFIAKKIGAEREGELALHFFKNTLVLSPIAFKQVLNMAGEGEQTQAFYFRGFSVIKTASNRLPGVTIMPLIHEWVHAFDAELGLRRDVTSREAIAYGLNLFIERERIKHNLKKRAISPNTSKDYLSGFALGKMIAMNAMEIKGRLGDYAVKRFFETLLMNRQLNPTFVDAVKNELLSQRAK